MKKIILSLLLMTTLCSCQEDMKRETIYVGQWSMTFLNDSSILATPRFESDTQKPYIIKIK